MPTQPRFRQIRISVSSVQASYFLLCPYTTHTQADYLTEYAEWLISSGQNDGDTAEDVLLSAADALLEYDVGEGGLIRPNHHQKALAAVWAQPNVCCESRSLLQC